MKINAKNVTILALSALLLNTQAAVLATSESTSDSNNPSASSSDKSDSLSPNSNEKQVKSELPNGLYLVFSEADDQKKLNPKGKQQTIVYDYQFFPLADRDAASYLVISTDEFIPLKLADEPQKEKDLQGKPKLMLQLAKDQVVPLEQFTTRNLGKAVAIVIGSKVVTKHKIKEAIKGGKMQITRCSDNGCDILYTQLQQNPQ